MLWINLIIDTKLQLQNRECKPKKTTLNSHFRKLSRYFPLFFMFFSNTTYMYMSQHKSLLTIYHIKKQTNLIENIVLPRK